MSDVPTFTSVEHAGWTVESNTGSSKSDVMSSLNPPKEPAGEEDEGKPDLSKAAADLGKKGGEAAAKARKAAEKEAKKDEEKPPEGEAKTVAAKPAEEPAKTAGTEDEKGKEPKSRAEERVREATREAAELKRELARVKAEVERIRTEAPAKPREEPRQEPPKAAARPKPEDFDDYEKYLDARDTFNRAQWRVEQERESYERSRAQQLDGTIRKFAEIASKQPAGWREALSAEVTDLQPTFLALQSGVRPSAGNWIADEFLLSPDAAPGIMTYLSEHPEELQRLVKLPAPRDVTHEMARLSARLEGATAGNPSSTEEPPAKVAVSKAHPPVRPVTGAPPTASNVPYRPGEHFDEYYQRHGPVRVRS